MTFKNYAQGLPVTFPYKGMKAGPAGGPYARYIQNMLALNDSTGKVRHGTSLTAKFAFDENRRFTEQIEIFSFKKTDGSSEILVYQNYLSKLAPDFLEEATEVSVEADGETSTIVSIDTSGYSDEEKAYLTKRVFAGVRIYVSQEYGENTYPAYADVSEVTEGENVFSFSLPFPEEFFSLDGGNPAFTLWVERGGIYKIENGEYSNPLIDDLDPNVIPISCDFAGDKFICNGIDPVLRYNGNTLSVAQTKNFAVFESIAQAGKVFTIKSKEPFTTEINTNVKAGTAITLSSAGVINQKQDVSCVSINFSGPDGNGVTTITLTIDLNPIEAVNGIIYKKDLEYAFSYMIAWKDRLWALAPGRSYKDKFKPGADASLVYFSYEPGDPEGWRDKNNFIQWIDISSNWIIVDNLEAIVPFYQNLLLVGRESLQEWTGSDPTSSEDGEKLELNDFRHWVTKPIGIVHKRAFCAAGDFLVAVSRYSILPLGYDSKSAQIYAPLVNFASPVSERLKFEIANIKTEREYRSISAFAYPFEKFVGFKIRNSCFIYSIDAGDEGAWSVFTDNFAEAYCFRYDSVSQNLYLGGKGLTLAYADKPGSFSYYDYGKEAISWTITYDTVYPGTTWRNDKVFAVCKSAEPTEVEVIVYRDFDFTDYKSAIVNIKQTGAVYDISLFDSVSYPYKEESFDSELLGFSCDSFAVRLSGVARNYFVLDRVYFAGAAL